MAKVKKTFRIEEDSYDELVKLAEEWDMSQGAAIERAIRLARQMPYTLPDRCQTDASTPGAAESAAVSALAAQLAVKDEQLAKKDEQIAKLMDAVADGQRTIQGAQALHHETAQALALEPAEQKKTGRWARLKAAWRG